MSYDPFLTQVTLSGRLLSVTELVDKIKIGQRAGLKELRVPVDNKKDIPSTERKVLASTGLEQMVGALTLDTSIAGM